MTEFHDDDEYVNYVDDNDSVISEDSDRDSVIDTSIDDDGGLIPLLIEFATLQYKYSISPFCFDINYYNRMHDLIIDMLVQASFKITLINRISAILKNYCKIYDWILKNVYENNESALDDPLNNFTTTPPQNKCLKYRLQRGIWRWLHFTKNNNIELIFAVPPRHWAFGKSPEQLIIPDCTETLTSKQFYKKYKEYRFGMPHISNYWWFIVIQPFNEQYNTLNDIVDAIHATPQEGYDILKYKNVISKQQIGKEINKFSNLLLNIHYQATGRIFIDRIKRANKHTRKRWKKHLSALDYNIA